MGWAAGSQTRQNPTAFMPSVSPCALLCALRCKEGLSARHCTAHSPKNLHELSVLHPGVEGGEPDTPRVHTNGTGGPLGSVQGSGLCRRGQGVAQPATLSGLRKT